MHPEFGVPCPLSWPAIQRVVEALVQNAARERNYLWGESRRSRKGRLAAAFFFVDGDGGLSFRTNQFGDVR